MKVGICNMTIYIILFLLILFSTIFINTKRSKRNKRIYIIITFGLMTLVAMLRKYTIGIDLQYLYHPTFIKITNISWYSLINSENLEIGYLFFCKFLTIISDDPQILIITTSLMTIPVVGWFIYEYSNNVKISTMLYVLLNIFFMSMNIVRQEIAVSFILIAFHFLQQNKKFISILFILLATSFHSSAIIMIPLFFLYGKKFKRSYIYITSIIILLLLNCYKFLLNIYSVISTSLNLSNNKDYATYLESDMFGVGNINLNSISSVVLIVGIFLVACYYIVLLNNTKDKEQLKKQYFYLFMTAIYMIVEIVSLKMVIIARLSYYFIPFSLLILPESLSLSKLSSNKAIILSILFILVFARFLYILLYLADSLYGVMPFQFFWE